MGSSMNTKAGVSTSSTAKEMHLTVAFVTGKVGFSAQGMQFPENWCISAKGRSS